MNKEDCPVGYGDCKNCISFIENSCKHGDPEYPNLCWNCSKPIKEGLRFCSKECEDYIKEEKRKEQEEAEKQYQKEQAVLKKVKEMCTPKFYELIEQEIEESDGGYDFRFADEPKGVYQDCIDDIKVWVDQTTNGGYTGDDFAGTVSIELPNKKYLEWDYSM